MPTRRTFLRQSAAAATAVIAGPTIIPSSARGADGHTAPSNRIAVGFIGTGNHGVDWNLPPYLKHASAQVVAVCDVDNLHLHRAKGMVNRHYQNADCFATRDFREILARSCRNLAQHYKAAGDLENAKLFTSFVEEFDATYERHTT